MSKNPLTLRRPLIDTANGGPMKFYGFRVTRDGEVYATTTAPRHGRWSKSYEVKVGEVRKQRASQWIGRTLDYQTQRFETQEAAAKFVYRDAQERQS